MSTAPLAVIIELTNGNGNQKRYTVANGTQISKGILLQLSDPRTAALSEAGGIPVGISAFEKEANDGSTSISVWTNGIFDIKASGAVTVGAQVCLAGQGEVRAATTTQAQASQALIFGTALETATDGEVINVRVNL